MRGNRRIRSKKTFEQRIKQLAGADEAKAVLFEYMKNEIYTMLGFIPEPNLDNFRRLGETLPVETILRIYELGVPNIFSLSIDVDKSQINERYRLAEAILRRLNFDVSSVGPSRPSDRFKTYAGSFLKGLNKRMIRDTQQGKLTLKQARRFLIDLVDMQDSQGPMKGYWFTPSLGDMTEALTSGATYRGQLEAQDIKLFIRVYEILGTKVSYALKADRLAKVLYNLAQDTTAAAENEIMDWLVHRDDGWNSLRAEFLKLDIKALFKEGQGIVFQGKRTEYLDHLLTNENIVKNMQDVLKVFVDAAQARTNSLSSEELVIMYQKIFTRFRKAHINNDLGIFLDLWIKTRVNNQMFSGDAFEKNLLDNVPVELKPVIEKARRELRPIFYIVALGGIPKDKDLRNFIFDALRVRENTESMFSDPEIISLIKNAQPEQKVYNEEDLSERYHALSYDDSQEIDARWDQINPEHRIENINNDEFDLIKSFS